MSLVSDDDEAMWADGSSRSLNTGFTRGFGEQISWKRLQLNHQNSIISTRTVERRRAAGEKNVGSIPLAGRKLESFTKRKGNIDIEPKQKVQGNADKRQKLKKASI